MYFNTFAGNPVSCAAANAVLDVLEREAAHGQRARRGRLRGRGLAAARGETFDDRRRARPRPVFRGRAGRDRATREPAGAEAKRIINAMRDRGVLISRIGPHDNILKIRPPMVFTKEHADLLLSTLDEVLAAR